jgi:hypothetical protein
MTNKIITHITKTNPPLEVTLELTEEFLEGLNHNLEAWLKGGNGITNSREIVEDTFFKENLLNVDRTINAEALNWAPLSSARDYLTILFKKIGTDVKFVDVKIS